MCTYIHSDGYTNLPCGGLECGYMLTELRNRSSSIELGEAVLCGSQLVGLVVHDFMVKLVYNIFCEHD